MMPFTGVTVIVAIIGVLPELIAVNGLIFPIPLAGRPIAGVSFVQVKELAVPENVTAVEEDPPVTDSFAMLVTVGVAYTTALTFNVCCATPVEVSVTGPLRFPAGADIADRTNTVSGPTVPDEGANERLLEYTPAALKDNSKFTGAVTMTGAVR